MNAMSPDIRQRFESLLLSLPAWQYGAEERRVAVKALRNHEIWDHLDLTGSAATAAVRLLDLFAEHGPEPFRALLSSLRDESVPGRDKEIEALDKALRVLGAQRVPARWNGVPYRGLSYFDREHAPIFFGREPEVDALIQTITTTEQGQRFCVVLGASGAGKSSLVRAGLWARLADSKDRWLISAMTPTEMGTPSLSLYASVVESLKKQDRVHDWPDLKRQFDGRPLVEFVDCLLPKAGERWLLILDQMEELFSSELRVESAPFLDRLLEASRTSSRFQVVATLRADFFQACLAPEYAPLTRVVSREGGQFLLRAPGRLALERMVSGPISSVELPAKWTMDPALPPAIAADAERHPGGLALMAFALRELYDLCTPQRRMDLETYRGEAFGGLSGCIARRANATMAAGGYSDAVLYRIFASLVRATPDDAPTRRRAALDTWKDDAEAQALVEAFVKARLLVADTHIEVAHEALLREWPKLAEWIDQRREAFGLLERVRADAKEWRSGDQSRRPLPTDRIEAIRTKLQDAGMLEEAEKDPDVARLLMPELDWILLELELQTTPDFRRWEIGKRLAEIGDPRPRIGVVNGLPDIVWCAIPSGPDVAAFEMAKYPITFAQWRSFCEAPDGFDTEVWWSDLKREELEPVWSRGLTNHPVTNVSWYDAMAFCRWLSARTGVEVRLPHEREWQWAAQSAQVDFTYPWGTEWQAGRANTNEADIKRTTAVGVFPDGDSLQSVCDLSGNVWEWCSNKYREDEASRVLRGGSWLNSSRIARADSRYNLRPNLRDDYFGFRVVRSAPIR